jgi:hopanoid biosynthesis associated protein HpnK
MTVPRPPIPLIVNGDDFGSSEGANRAIIQAHREGVLSSASLMVNEPAAADAVRLARENPGLAVGLHLVLALGRSTLSPAEIPHLADQDGNLASSPLRAGLHYYFSRAAKGELPREMRAQFDKFIATGLPFSHVDGHAHLHMHPTIFDQLIELCEEYGVRRVRVVKGELRVQLRLDRRRLPLKLLWGVVFNLLGRSCERRLRGRGFTRPKRVYGLLQTGDLNEDYLLRLLAQMDSASSEIYAHPLAPDADAAARGENPGGVREFQALTSARVREAIRAAGFRLATYDGLGG